MKHLLAPLPAGLVTAGLVVGAAASQVGAPPPQVYDWEPHFGFSGPSEDVTELAVFDDGSGPALFVTGDYRYWGSQEALGVVRWDGSVARPIGLAPTCPENTSAMEVLDVGSGPLLYATDGFWERSWDGASWTYFGNGLSGNVYDYEVFDDGTGPALYATGSFGSGGSGVLNHIARLEGGSWQPLGAGLDDNGLALTVYEGQLIVVGDFTQAGGAPAQGVASWDGTAWGNLAGGPPTTAGRPFSLAVYDSGGQSELYIGGNLLSSLGDRILRWDGSSWSSVGGSLGFTPPNQGRVNCMLVHDDGSGPQLYVGGNKLIESGTSYDLLRWDGAAWEGLLLDGPAAAAIEDMEFWDDGAGTALYLGLSGSGDLERLQRWDGVSVTSAVGGGQALSGQVLAFGAYDDGTGLAAIAGGDFLTAGGTPVNRVARWDGCAWQPLGSGVNGTVYALEAFDDGTGPGLVAGGAFTGAGGAPATGVARWDGSAWNPLGSGLEGGIVRALAVHDDGTGPALYAGGTFTSSGGAPVGRVARWDGGAWGELGGGADGTVRAFLSTTFDGAPALIVGGAFQNLGALAASRIARWDGLAFHSIDGGTNGPVHALAMNAGGRIVAGGSFSQAGAVTAFSVARILPNTGATWTTVSPGQSVWGSIDALVAHDFSGGGQLTLVIGGDFDTEYKNGGDPNNASAQLDNYGWSELGEPNNVVTALASYDLGAPGGRTLLVGGAFRLVDGLCERTNAHGVAALELPSSNPVSYCTPGTSANGCRARLAGYGKPSSSASETFIVSATDVEGAKQALLFWGANGRQANPWGNGSSWSCVQLPVFRSAPLVSSGVAGTCDGVIDYDLTARWQAKPNQNPGPGALTQIQLWYRDPQNTSNQTTSLSDALEFLTCP